MYVCLLRARPREQLAVGRIKEVLASCRRDCRVWGSLGMRPVYMCGSKGEAPVGLAVGGPGESWPAVCVCAHVHSLRGSYVQMPATGETECLNPPAGWVHIMNVCVCMCVYIFCWCCLRLCECFVCMSLYSVWPILCICICDAYVCFVCVCVLGIHFPPGYWLDLGAWSCSSFSSLRLSDLT